MTLMNGKLMILQICNEEKMMKITSYFIDDNDVMHTYCGELKHITMSDVKNDEQAEKIINELNSEIN